MSPTGKRSVRTRIFVLEEHPLRRVDREVLEDEDAVALRYVGPTSPDLYEKLGLGRKKE